MKNTISASGKKRRSRQWILLWLVPITISLGWKYPLIGYTVPLVMLAGMIGSFYRGRYVCGNLCPRGGFLERILAPMSRNRRIPEFVRSASFRGTAFVLLMGFMLYRGLQQPTSLAHWGYVFWTMCVVTTVVAVLLAILIHPRTWCSFCPMGTMQNVIGGTKGQLLIEADLCKGCKLCEKSCSFTLAIVANKEKGYLPERDCLKCSECINVCPTKALHWPEEKKVWPFPAQQRYKKAA
ncbi:MAG: 4Fe-4S binding protein [Desulfobulbaceae bacterium]|nr:4Fe-4S binding protein [Desulfobulbaceae bacterium]